MIILLTGSCQWMAGTWPSVRLGDSLSCRQSRCWTKRSCSYLCCELRNPSQVTLAWQTVHTNSPNHLFLWARWKVCFISRPRLAVVWLSKMLCCLDWLWCVQSEPTTADGRGRGGLTVRPVNPRVLKENKVKTRLWERRKPLSFSRGCCILEIRARKTQTTAVNAPDKGVEQFIR